jgi:hypothetical protein
MRLLAGVFLARCCWDFLAASGALLKILFTAMIVSFALDLVLLNWQERQFNDSIPVERGAIVARR